MTVKLLTEYDLEFLCLKSGCTGSSKSRLNKMPDRWLSHVGAHIGTLIVLLEMVLLTSRATLPLHWSAKHYHITFE